MALAIMLSATINHFSHPLLQPSREPHALRHSWDRFGKACWRMSRPKRAQSSQCFKDAEIALDGCSSESNGNGEKRLFVFGLGFTTLELATALQRQGWQVSGTCRSEEKREALELRGLKTHLFDSEGEEECLEEEAMQDLLSSTHLVSSIPPGGFSCADPVLANLKNEVLQSHALRWIGYLSSTSVYGDWQGEWVSEDTEPQPVERRAMSRWEAEKEWLQVGQEAGICTRVFRLGGIYGPGRSALDTILRGEKLSDRQRRRGRKRFTARIHVADICQVIMKAMAMSQGEWLTRVYNVVDDDPTSRADVMAYAHTLLQTAKNAEGEGSCASEDDDASSVKREGSTSGGVAEKRVSNKRVKEELQVQLLYPSFKSGMEGEETLRSMNSCCRHMPSDHQSFGCNSPGQWPIRFTVWWTTTPLCTQTAKKAEANDSCAPKDHDALTMKLQRNASGEVLEEWFNHVNHGEEALAGELESTCGELALASKELPPT